MTVFNLRVLREFIDKLGNFTRFKNESALCTKREETTWKI